MSVSDRKEWAIKNIVNDLYFVKIQGEEIICKMKSDPDVKKYTRAEAIKTMEKLNEKGFHVTLHLV